jgi:hypothetical protein
LIVGSYGAHSAQPKNKGGEGCACWPSMRAVDREATMCVRPGSDTEPEPSQHDGVIVPERWQPYIRRVAGRDCWFWSGRSRVSLAGHGPRVIRYQSPKRAFYLHFHGPIPPRRKIYQTCGFNPCIYPGHLVTDEDILAMQGIVYGLGFDFDLYADSMELVDAILIQATEIAKRHSVSVRYLTSRLRCLL